MASKMLERPDLAEKLRQAHEQGRLLDAEAAMKEITSLIHPGTNAQALPPTKRWDNHEWVYIKCAVESDDYDQALGEGYEEFSTNGGNYHVLRKKKRA